MAKSKASVKVLIRTSLLDGSSLQSLVEKGAGAIETAHLRLISEDQRKRISDSLNLDEALKKEHPDSNRWDYIVSVNDPGKLIGIEPHTAKDSEASVIIRKKTHAAETLRLHLKDGKCISEWYWVTEGKSSFSKMDKTRRSLDQHGIKFKGRMITEL